MLQGESGMSATVVEKRIYAIKGMPYHLDKREIQTRLASMGWITRVRDGRADRERGGRGAAGVPRKKLPEVTRPVRSKGRLAAEPAKGGAAANCSRPNPAEVMRVGAGGRSAGLPARATLGVHHPLGARKDRVHMIS